jgi:hypothetical protein
MSEKDCWFAKAEAQRREDARQEAIRIEQARLDARMESIRLANARAAAQRGSLSYDSTRAYYYDEQTRVAARIAEDAIFNRLIDEHIAAERSQSARDEDNSSRCNGMPNTSPRPV